MVFKADEFLNGKIKMDIRAFNRASVYVYMMPNNFNDKYGTHGILENNKYFAKTGPGSFSVPTDWKIIISYNPQIFSGYITVNSWVEEYTREDEELIKKVWQPTGTSFIDSQLAAKSLVK